MLRNGAIEHRRFVDLPRYFRAGDVLVLNETRVIAARLRSGGIEILLLHPVHGRYSPDAARWWALVKPGRKMRSGREVAFGGDATARVLSIRDDGAREIEFDLHVPFEELLRRHGSAPLPPYIHSSGTEVESRYQTIFAREPGSVAAPTASLHFTERIFETLHAAGVEIVKLVLDVGLGTFRPVQTERIDEHAMHAETFEIPQEACDAIARAKGEGRRVVAAGTTVLRALEGSAQRHGSVRPGPDETAIFITPGFAFRVVDALITNFHLPRSTLLMLVSAFAGREVIVHAYAEAVAQEYRFYSFGDAMYIEP